jgi:hypothetical protein
LGAHPPGGSGQTVSTEDYGTTTEFALNGIGVRVAKYDNRCTLAARHHRHDTGRAAGGQGSPIIHKLNACGLVRSTYLGFEAVCFFHSQLRENVLIKVNVYVSIKGGRSVPN